MDVATLSQMRAQHPAWRLLLADHAPLVASFLHQAFIVPNERSLAESVLQSRLEDTLFQLRDQQGDAAYPRSAGDYLNDWADNEKGWLRKFYPLDSDEAHFDLTPATEKVITWLESLTQRQFVGTESRLRTVFDLLQQMLSGADTDPQTRLQELELRKTAIEREIEQVQAGDIPVMDDTALRERFQQLSSTARELLGDFREVEQNFRQLDRQAREQITTWEGRKGDLLEHIFGERDAISDSDQGRTFRAFWDFLMSSSHQEKLTQGLQALYDLPPIQAMAPDPRLKRIHFDWLDAGEQTQRTVARLSQQLRRFLDDQTYLENRRIMQLIQGIEQQALAVREAPPQGTFMALESPQAQVQLPMDRPLFTPPLKPDLDTRLASGDEAAVDPEALFNQTLVDHTRLQANINRALQGRQRVTLTDIIRAHPLQVGLAELVAYLSLAGQDRRATFDDSAEDPIHWTDEHGRQRPADRRHRFGQIHPGGRPHHAAGAGTESCIQQGGRRRNPGAFVALLRARLLPFRAQ